MTVQDMILEQLKELKEMIANISIKLTQKQMDLEDYEIA